jgi:hypothetical protein
MPSVIASRNRSFIGATTTGTPRADRRKRRQYHCEVLAILLSMTASLAAAYVLFILVERPSQEAAKMIPYGTSNVCIRTLPNPDPNLAEGEVTVKAQ